MAALLPPSLADIRALSADIYHFTSCAPVSLVISEWNEDHYYSAAAPAQILPPVSFLRVPADSKTHLSSLKLDGSSEDREEMRRSRAPPSRSS